MRIVVFNWRDLAHPLAGGAEVYTDIVARGLVARGHEVTLRTASFLGAPRTEVSRGYKVVRAGNAITCRMIHAAWLMQNHKMVDVVVDEVNTLPFLSPVIAPTRTVLLMHQIAREIWEYETAAVIGWIGRRIEPLLLRIYRDTPSITVSASTTHSLREIGLRGRNVVVYNALRPPVEQAVTNPEVGTIVYVGRVTPSKRIDHLLRAVSLARLRCPVRLVIVGGGKEKEFRRLQSLAAELDLGDAVEFRGRVSNTERDEQLSRADLLALTSIREGWGLVVSEAARWRVPAVGYDVPGLRDSIVDRVTGVLVREGDVAALAGALVELIKDRPRRQRMGESAAAYLTRFGEDATVRGFEAALLAAVEG